ncbi:MAG: leucyl aminopeptidase [Deltaproteobacteria bacterium]|nr:leucyl aminopeptidase [Deltaproteobacteria bacterium]
MPRSRNQVEVTLASGAAVDTRAELLVLVVDADWQSGALVPIDERLKGALVVELQRQGFRGADGQVGAFQTHGVLPCAEVLVAGVDAAGGPDAWYRLADTVVGHARTAKVRTAAMVLPAATDSGSAATVVEGLDLAGYVFDRLKSASNRTPSLERIQLLGVRNRSAVRAGIEQAHLAARATRYARDLINLPAAIVTPSYLGREARRIAQAQRLRVRVLGPVAIKRAGMGALLGVAQGSAEPACFIELTYRPRQRPVKRIALAGKGITFDSGGLSLKTAESMQAQKRDMAGGAVVLAVMSVVRDLRLPLEVRGYVPATENMPGGRALKPGDVVRAFNGKSIEVLNTDAEGRLVLADALAYAAAAKPDVIIDLATLTAAVRTALGSRYAGVMGTDPALVRELIAAARACAENLWELPLVAAYRSELDSSVADLKNIGDGGSGAGTIVAGLFLREFVAGTPWAHIDFSSTAVVDKPIPCHPRGATGFGVRTVLRYLQGVGR